MKLRSKYVVKDGLEEQNWVNTFFFWFLDHCEFSWHQRWRNLSRGLLLFIEKGVGIQKYIPIWKGEKVTAKYVKIHQNTAFFGSKVTWCYFLKKIGLNYGEFSIFQLILPLIFMLFQLGRNQKKDKGLESKKQESREGAPHNPKIFVSLT